jgi:hypothetical protein
MRDGGTSVQQIKKGVVAEVLESIYIPAITGAPFTAIVHTEWVRYLADGGTFTLANQRLIARDSEGRIYQERWTLVPKNGRIASERTTIQLPTPTLFTTVLSSTSPATVPWRGSTKRPRQSINRLSERAVRCPAIRVTSRTRISARTALRALKSTARATPRLTTKGLSATTVLKA